ncbi:relaxase domain-containing protein [Blastomonas fulva]|nr:relaxase domain-containing protein [Blastomonas fulva]
MPCSSTTRPGAGPAEPYPCCHCCDDAGQGWQWKALWNGEIWKNNTVLGSIYNAALRTNLEKLGYETQITGKHGQFEIKGWARCDRSFQPASPDHSGDGRELGKSANDAEALREITSAPRSQAESDDKLALRQEWAKRAAGLGFDAKALVEQARERGSEARESPLGSPQRVQETLSVLRDSVKLYTRPADTLTTNGLQRITLTPTQLRTEMATASAIRVISERETSWTGATWSRPRSTSA